VLGVECEWVYRVVRDRTLVEVRRASTTHEHSDYIRVILYLHKSFALQTTDMHFSLTTFVATLAATASAVSLHHNGTTTAYYPTGTVSLRPTGTGVKPTSQPEFTGGAAMPTGGAALGLFVAGGVAMVSLM